MNIDNPLAALGPISWDTIDHDALDHFLADTFASAQILADSIPATGPSTASSSTGRPRSHTDGAVSYGLHAPAPPSVDGPSASEMSAKAEKLRQDLRQTWKEVKTGNASTNPRGIVVYKMNGGRDGYAGSSWFARRSVHRLEKGKQPKKDKAYLDGPEVEIGFDMFREALLKEFALPDRADESTEKKGGSVRTMITKKRVEHVVVDGQAHEDLEAEEKTRANTDGPPPTSRQLDVYLLEAEFPGPTTARDFVTMLLTTQSPALPPANASSSHSGLRQFMLVSKPCLHPETPQRSGYVRAQYESVEVIREVRVPSTGGSKSGRGLAGNPRKTRSSIDLLHGDDIDVSDHDAGDGHETVIEWLMITRNNPGGNVPRFLVDKSTPSSIISDANKFMDWLVAQQVEEILKSGEPEQTLPAVDAVAGAKTSLAAAIPEEEETEHDQANEINSADTRSDSSPPVTIVSMESSGGAASSAKLFNMLSGALGGAGTAVASKLPNPFGDAVHMIHSSFEGNIDLDDDDSNDIDSSDNDTGGDTYSDIDDDDVGAGAEKTRGRSRRSTRDSKAAGNDKTKTVADNASVASIPPPPPTTALEMLAHDRALALRKLNDRSSTGLSTGGSSVTASDIENDTEAGSATASSKQKKAEQHAAAKAAKAAKAADAARKKHEKELQKLQDKQKKAEADILKASKGKTGVEALKEKEDKERGVSSSAQSTKSAAHSSTSSLTTDPTATELQKLREKHDKAVARQEAQYKKEMEKLERKRQQQAEKEAARLKKQQERDEKADTALQLTHARAERDVFQKQVEMLTERVRQLESQNELLAAEVAQATGKSKLNARVEDAED